MCDVCSISIYERLRAGGQYAFYTQAWCAAFVCLCQLSGSCQTGVPDTNGEKVFRPHRNFRAAAHSKSAQVSRWHLSDYTGMG